MEVRCESCNKLFKIADEKISGSGIKFACSKCGDSVKITKEDFERHLRSQQTEPEPVQQDQKSLKMEVRCGNCNKLFQVSGDKITGSGIKFSCSKCGSVVKITRDEYENYRPSHAVVPVQDAHPPQPLNEPAPVEPDAAPTIQRQPNEPVSTEAVFPSTPQAPAPPIPPTPAMQPESAPKPAPVAAPRTAPPSRAREAIPVQPIPAKTAPPVLPVKQPSAAVAAAGKAEPSVSKRNMLVLAFAIIMTSLIAYGLIVHKQSAKPDRVELGNFITTNEGLQVVNLTGVLDAKGDLIISGMIINATDKERSAWLVVADVFDAQGALLRQTKVLNGKQLYTQLDYDIVAKRGEDVQALKSRMLQSQGVKIPPRGAIPFEVVVMEPPTGYASFNAAPHPFNPIQLYTETTDTRKTL